MTTQAPSRPQNHSVTLVGGLPQLIWDASTDNIGVAGYAIHRSTDGSLGRPVITTVGPVTTYIDNTVVSGERYTYAVSAFDAAGNVSPNSRLRSVTCRCTAGDGAELVGLTQAAATTAITVSA